MNALRLRMLPCAYAYRTCEHPCAYTYACVVRVNQPLGYGDQSDIRVHSPPRPETMRHFVHPGYPTVEDIAEMRNSVV